MRKISKPQKFFSPVFLPLWTELRQHKATLHNIRPRNTTAKLAANRGLLTLDIGTGLRARIRSVTLLEEMRQKAKISGERLTDANLEVSRQIRKPRPEVRLA